MNRVFALSALCWAVDVQASTIDVGVGVDLAGDLADPNMEQGASKMGIGPTVRAPVRLELHPVVSIRSDVFLSFQGGQDRVEWTQFNGVVDYQSDDHWTMLSQLGLNIGPEISPWSTQPVSIYAGTNIGIAWARHWHSFKGSSAVLLDPDSNDVNSGSNIDPYTDQAVPSVGLHSGVRFKDVLPFAFEVELGYKVAFMREAELKKARPTLQAKRTAYGYNPVRIGINAVFPL